MRRGYCICVGFGQTPAHRGPIQPQFTGNPALGPALGMQSDNTLLQIHFDLIHCQSGCLEMARMGMFKAVALLTDLGSGLKNSFPTSMRQSIWLWQRRRSWHEHLRSSFALVWRSVLRVIPLG